MKIEGHFRAPWHDYTTRCIYHITMKKRHGMPDFGRIEWDRSRPISSETPVRVAYSPIGFIVRNIIYNIPKRFPHVNIWQWCVMPDHVHILLFISVDAHEHLGEIIKYYKGIVNDEVRDKIFGSRPLADVVQPTDPEREGTGVFVKNFNDQVILKNRHVDTIVNYIRQNPWRRAVIMSHPDYFSRLSEIVIAGKTYQAYGNLQLLRCPFLAVVVVHRADDEATRRRNRERWIHVAANCGVLISAWISPAEKEIRDQAADCGGRIIKLQRELFGPKDKPHGVDFALCSEGRMLILIPKDLPDVAWREEKHITRPCALYLNSLATEIAATVN